MRLYGFGRIHRLARKARLKIQPKAHILAYHRVADLNSDPQLLSVAPRHFAEHLQHVSENYHPVSLVELGRALIERRIPRHAIVITFDDGYADNFWNARPLLEKYNVPATVFVTTGYVGEDREFWCDELGKLLLLPEKLPESLELSINGEFYKWSLHEAGKTGDQDRKWNVTMKISPSPRLEAYKDIHRLLRPLEDEEQQKILAELAIWAGISRNARPGYQALNPSELIKLMDNGLIEIGSHTITHPVLSALSPDKQRTEIFQSKRYLEEILGCPVSSFSYPYGGKWDAGEDTIEVVREAGYRLACANFAAPVTRNSDPYWLPRFLVRDWNGDEFAKRLRRFFSSYD